MPKIAPGSAGVVDFPPIPFRSGTYTELAPSFAGLTPIPPTNPPPTSWRLTSHYQIGPFNQGIAHTDASPGPFSEINSGTGNPAGAWNYYPGGRDVVFGQTADVTVTVSVAAGDATAFDFWTGSYSDGAVSDVYFTTPDRNGISYPGHHYLQWQSGQVGFSVATTFSVPSPAAVTDDGHTASITVTLASALPKSAYFAFVPSIPASYQQTPFDAGSLAPYYGIGFVAAGSTTGTVLVPGNALPSSLAGVTTSGYIIPVEGFSQGASVSAGDPLVMDAAIAVTVTVTSVAPPPPPPPPAYFPALQCVNDAFGRPTFFRGNTPLNPAVLYRTDDGGATYKAITLNPVDTQFFIQQGRLVIHPVSNLISIVYPNPHDKDGNGAINLDIISTHGDATTRAEWSSPVTFGPPGGQVLGHDPVRPEVLYVSYGGQRPLYYTKDGFSVAIPGAANAGLTYPGEPVYGAPVAPLALVFAGQMMFTVGHYVLFTSVAPDGTDLYHHGVVGQVSTDSGLTWRPSTVVSPLTSPKSSLGLQYITACVRGHELFVAWAEDVVGAPSPTGQPSGTVRLSKSSDLGQTWTVIGDTSKVQPPLALGVWPDSGRLMLNPRSYSDDGGITWIVSP